MSRDNENDEGLGGRSPIYMSPESILPRSPVAEVAMSVNRTLQPVCFRVLPIGKPNHEPLAG